MIDSEDANEPKQPASKLFTPHDLSNPTIRGLLLDTVQKRLNAVRKVEQHHFKEMIEARNMWDSTLGKLRGWLIGWGVSTVVIAFQTVSSDDPLPKWAIVIALVSTLVGLGLIVYDAYYDRIRLINNAKSSGDLGVNFNVEAAKLENDLMTLVHWHDGLEIGFELRDFEPPEIKFPNRTLYDYLFPAGGIGLALGTALLMAGYIAC